MAWYIVLVVLPSDLHHNNLTTFPIGVFDFNHQLTYLDLRNNPSLICIPDYKHIKIEHDPHIPTCAPGPGPYGPPHKHHHSVTSSIGFILGMVFGSLGLVLIIVAIIFVLGQRRRQEMSSGEFQPIGTSPES